MNVRTFLFGLTALLLLALGIQGPVFAVKIKKHRDDSCCKDLKRGIHCLKKELKKPSCCSQEIIDQKKVNKARGLLTLNKSGNYALAEDVVGTIILAADSICLDLCCHTLSAGGKANAIIANGRKALA